MSDKRLVLVSGADVSHLHVGDHAPERIEARQRLSVAYNEAGYAEAVEKIARAISSVDGHEDMWECWVVSAKDVLAALGWTEEAS
jgi:hypothetical protein